MMGSAKESCEEREQEGRVRAKEGIKTERKMEGGKKERKKKLGKTEKGEGRKRGRRRGRREGKRLS